VLTRVSNQGFSVEVQLAEQLMVSVEVQPAEQLMVLVEVQLAEQLMVSVEVQQVVQPNILMDQLSSLVVAQPKLSVDQLNISAVDKLEHLEDLPSKLLVELQLAEQLMVSVEVQQVVQPNMLEDQLSSLVVTQPKLSVDQLNISAVDKQERLEDLPNRLLVEVRHKLLVVLPLSHIQSANLKLRLSHIVSVNLKLKLSHTQSANLKLKLSYIRSMRANLKHSSFRIG